jgi:hypothetical protein
VVTSQIMLLLCKQAPPARTERSAGRVWRSGHDGDDGDDGDDSDAGFRSILFVCVCVLFTGSSHLALLPPQIENPPGRTALRDRQNERVEKREMGLLKPTGDGDGGGIEFFRSGLGILMNRDRPTVDGIGSSSRHA